MTLDQILVAIFKIAIHSKYFVENVFENDVYSIIELKSLVANDQSNLKLKCLP